MRGALLLLLTCAVARPEGDPARAMLAAHNAVRAKVRVPALEWSVRLENVARTWAKTIVADGRLRHRPDTSYGENLFVIEGERATPGQVTASWASEAADYNAERNVCRAGRDCAHYTQIVWRNTKLVGCASASRGDREVWVCYYDPAGNWVGERPF